VRKLLLKAGFAPGDGVALTAAVRDLHRSFPDEFQTDVETPYADLWRHNPYVHPLDPDAPDVEHIECDYPLIQSANQTPVHCLNGFVQFLSGHLQRHIRLTEFKGDIHLSAEEQNLPSQVESLLGTRIPYWIISAGGKFDLTVKWWEHKRWQAVVDHFRDRILFVQVGDSKHYHPRLDGVLDLRGWTSLRQLIHLVYHAQGVLCPVTCLMHLAAAVPTRSDQSRSRPCVVVAGGREPAHWEQYPGHQFLHTVGSLPCCASGGCWKRRTIPLGDGRENDATEHLCAAPVGDLPRCMDMISPDDVIRRIEYYFEGGTISPLTSAQAENARRAPQLSRGTALDEDSVTRGTARRALEKFVTQIPSCPKGFRGRGIVMAASGRQYVTCAWVCVRMLRHVGCRLPVEIWHRGSHEWSPTLTRLFEPHGVRVVDASAVLQRHPARIEHKYGLKPYAILHASFRELLWLDADQVPVQDPTFLFDTPQFKETGAVFWPDYYRFDANNPIWRYTNIPYRDEPEVQGGELLIDKNRCWKALRLALWFNEHHRFFYRYINGDKDTFRFGWHKLGYRYVMMPFPIHPLEGTMCQHDFSGRRLWQHRNMRKWNLYGPNADVQGFEYQDECLNYVAELRSALEASEDASAVKPQAAECTV
jgi:ADP-heptose:LPS heptosyltransferase